MSRHVVMYSGGIGSWATAKWVIDRYGTDDVTLLFADVKGDNDNPHLGEDEDTYRFIRESAEKLGAELVWLKEGRSIWQVFHDDRFLGNSRLANCSKFLKQRPCREWLDKNVHSGTATVYVGIDWSEAHRLPAIEAAYQPYFAKAPLIDPPYVDKQQMLQACREWGVEPPRMYSKNYPHGNCLAPETRYITSEGIKTLAETVGQTVKVLGTGAGWREANIRSFGVQSLTRIELRRYSDTKTVESTPDHLWPVRKARGRATFVWKSTSDLQPGDQIASMYGQVRHNVTPSAIGVAAGFTFGDGTIGGNSGQVNPARAFLCGDKDQALLPYFSSCRSTRRVDHVVVVHDLPRSWKQAPDLSESQTYLYGWLAGYFAADGTVAKGMARIASSSKDNLEVVRDVSARIGIATRPIRMEMRKGYGAEKTPLYTVSLVLGTLREDFFIIPEHRKRFTSVERIRPADWTISAVTPDVSQREVMCAVVPAGNAFTLEDNLFTHNCGGFCVRAGQAQFRLLLNENRERYLFHEGEEQKLREHLGKDVAILRDRAGGTSTPLTLKAFRERQERGGQDSLFDDLDWGGCGCFVEPS